ncbi:hypothetical protein [Streptomyces sp. NRRL F-5755]|uniref:hypothetical protein n=1 Tax=Streptomyces sp. NRRL F-5755 TaxID=1519475 RepID=UPI0006AFE2E8|nr:hypothetical protein [Streptomyces sp. NRRL F-5755]
MHKHIARRVAAALAATAVLAGVTGCQDGGDKTKGAAGTRSSQEAGQAAGKRTPTQALTAAYKKTAAAKSAKVTMTMSMPASMAGGGRTRITGVMGWGPLVMDVTVTQSGAAAAGGAEKNRLIWVDDVMYMDLGERIDGSKTWAKMDLKAVAAESGDAGLAKQLTAGLSDIKQDPAQQLALLLNSPNVKHLGSGEVNGQRAEHYKGSLTLQEALKGQKSTDLLSPQEREKLLANMKKSGLKGYDYDVWVNGDDLPVQMNVDMQTPQGKIGTATSYSDYGAKATVQAPPPAETADLLQMFKELGTKIKQQRAA